MSVLQNTKFDVGKKQSEWFRQNPGATQAEILEKGDPIKAGTLESDAVSTAR